MKVIITILGLSGTSSNDQKAIYSSKILHILKQGSGEFFNMFELLCKNAHFFKNGEFVLAPVATKDAYELNLKMISKCGVDSKILVEPTLIDDKNFGDIFAKIANILDKYDEAIIDITHGFRSIPILMSINLMIQNFSDTQKIKHILFAKEIEKHTKETQGIYEIIDLKNYLDLANIAFLARNFSQNYTITQNVKIKGFNELIECMKNFNENILALDLYELQKSSTKLLEQINLCLDDEKNVSIFRGLKMMQDEILSIKNLLDFSHKTRHSAFIELSEKMSQKGYLLNALALLFEASKEFLLYKISEPKHRYDNLSGKERYILLQNLISWLGDKKLDFKNFQTLKEYFEYKTALNHDYEAWKVKLSELFYGGVDILEYIKCVIGRNLDKLEIVKISNSIENAKQYDTAFNQLFGDTKNIIVTRKWQGGSKNFDEPNFAKYKELFDTIRISRNDLLHVKTSQGNSGITKTEIDTIRNELKMLINATLV